VILLPVRTLCIFIEVQRMCVQQACLTCRVMCHGFAYYQKDYGDHLYALGCSFLARQIGTGTNFFLHMFAFPMSLSGHQRSILIVSIHYQRCTISAVASSGKLLSLSLIFALLVTQENGFGLYCIGRVP
jgi:hypothetical protein